MHEGSALRRRAGGYAHAKQFRRLRTVIKRQCTILGVVMREIERKCAGIDGVVTAGTQAVTLAMQELQMWLERAERIRVQQRHDKNKQGLVIGARTSSGNPYDAHTLKAALTQVASLIRDIPATVNTVVADVGYRGVDKDNP